MIKKHFKIIIIFLLLIETSFLYLSCKSLFNKKIDTKENPVVNREMFAMYIEKEEGEYEEVTDTDYFPSGYKINIEKSSCVDGKGNIIENLLVLKNDKITVTSNKTVFCYIYFDINNSVYQKVKSDYQNNNGAALLEETESDEYPIYYYTGDITNNNIMYGGFCWKMVRTTETGGVKLIYNGKPQPTDDGISCNNTGEDATIGKSSYNSVNSIASVGYMYNTLYQNRAKAFYESRYIFNSYLISSSYYFADTVTWDGNKYVLSNSDGSDVTTYTWTDSYNDLVEYYTCLSTTSTSCEDVYYVIASTSTYMYYYTLSSGNDYDDYIIKLASSITDNGDGTYTLINPIEIKKIDWYTNYSKYKNYYYCSDFISETCNTMYYLTSPGALRVNVENVSSVYKYGNSFKYENGRYTLIDTKEFWNWQENYNKINNNHYTCFNTTGECEQVHYIYNTISTSAYYITLNDGKSVEDAINEMLYAEDVNKTNSTTKTTIDTWYESNILDKKDEFNNLYSSYLENTIWCNNRQIKSLGGWNPNGGDIASVLAFNFSAMECTNKTDQFTLKVESGGTDGYGNNALDYPIGLINNSEADFSTVGGYLKGTASRFWLLSPQSIHNSYVFVRTLGANSEFPDTYNIFSYNYDIRPSISLSLNVDIINGNGTYTNPYQIELNNE